MRETRSFSFLSFCFSWLLVCDRKKEELKEKETSQAAIFKAQCFVFIEELQVKRKEKAFPHGQKQREAPRNLKETLIVETFSLMKFSTFSFKTKRRPTDVVDDQFDLYSPYSLPSIAMADRFVSFFFFVFFFFTFAEFYLQ